MWIRRILALFGETVLLHGYQLKANTIFNPENIQAIAVIIRQYHAEGVVATI